MRTYIIDDDLGARALIQGHMEHEEIPSVYAAAPPVQSSTGVTDPSSIPPVCNE